MVAKYTSADVNISNFYVWEIETERTRAGRTAPEIENEYVVGSADVGNAASCKI